MIILYIVEKNIFVVIVSKLLVQEKYQNVILKTASKLMTYKKANQVNLLVYGSDRPHFKQKQKNNLTKFWPACFFSIYHFLLFEKNRK